MKLTFSYSLDKDVENFINGAKSVNNPAPTKFHQLYIEKHGKDLNEVEIKIFIEGYLNEKGIDTLRSTQIIKSNWLSIEGAFIKRCEDIFGIIYPLENIDVYLTTNNRCTYNISQGYFFVRVQGLSSNRTIMHELLHFYTWQVFYKKLKDKGLSELQYNDIKESLTELLNIEFVDLMGEEIDMGYPQHQEMRKKIKELWLADKDIHKVVSILAQ